MKGHLKFAPGGLGKNVHAEVCGCNMMECVEVKAL